jgi:hypothetical protein
MNKPGRQVADQDQFPLQWYSRRDGVVRGPFAAEAITRYLLLGRIRLDDELSIDRAAWSPVRLFSSLLPPEVANLASWDDYEQLIEARMQVDERKSDRRCQHCTSRDPCHSDRRTGKDRRHQDDAGPLRQYLYTNVDREPTLRPLLLTLLLATVMFAWLFPGQL